MHTARDETAARLASIVESSDDAIISKDLNGYITSWNSAAERMFGYTPAEMVGRHITTIIPIERRSEEDHVINEIRHGRRVGHFETVRCRKDGSLIDVSLTVSPIHASDGHVIGASKIARDITEQKRLQQAAAEASRAKDEFLATLSHELRTPLNTVLGYTQMLQSGTLHQAGLEKALEAISRNGEALTRLVNDVLDVSRIVTGKMQLNLERSDLAAHRDRAAHRRELRGVRQQVPHDLPQPIRIAGEDHPVGKLESTDGVTGIRVSHNSDALVTNFAVGK